jgi:hypothetical protein
VLDLFPQSYAHGTYVLVVSMTDQTGLVGAQAALHFTIVAPGTDAGTAAADAGTKPGDASSKTDVATPEVAVDLVSAMDTPPSIDSASGRQEVGAADLPAVDAAKPTGVVAGGYWQRKGITSSPPGKPTYAESCCNWELTWQAGLVTWSGVKDIGGVRSTYTLRFEWSEPPSIIRPGEVWPISAKATIVSMAGSPNVDGSVEARINGGSLLPLNSLGGSTVRISTNTRSAGFTASTTSTVKAGDGGQNFTLQLSAANGNKDYNAEYYYAYNWVP